MVGGLEVELTFPQEATGCIRIINSLRDSCEDYSQLSSLAEDAINGITHYAQTHNIDLTKYDITLSRFFTHDTASHPHLYFVTAQNALQSALAAWEKRPPA